MIRSKDLTALGLCRRIYYYVVSIYDPFVVLYSVPILQSGKEGGKICVTIWKFFRLHLIRYFRKTKTFKRCIVRNSHC